MKVTSVIQIEHREMHILTSKRNWQKHCMQCNVALSIGFLNDMIALVLQHLLKLTSVEKVENVLPVCSKGMAATVFSFIRKHLATETSTAAPP